MLGSPKEKNGTALGFPARTVPLAGDGGHGSTAPSFAMGRTHAADCTAARGGAAPRALQRQHQHQQEQEQEQQQEQQKEQEQEQEQEQPSVARLYQALRG
ncbi:hypothetical protein [Stenotrophomonas nematodicola]|uniref:Uncharacterized protein n=1 Tax=Stenotrophomonas nematodicola TaxID=2656746 RepID=A0ABW7CUD4_9GAMM